jgi:hypothetical protein
MTLWTPSMRRRGVHQLVAIDGLQLVDGAKRLVRALENHAP